MRRVIYAMIPPDGKSVSALLPTFTMLHAFAIAIVLLHPSPIMLRRHVLVAVGKGIAPIQVHDQLKIRWERHRCGNCILIWI